MYFQELEKDFESSYHSFILANEGSFLQTWSWGNFQESLGKKVFRFGVFDQEGGKLILTAQILEQTAQGKKYFFAPYGPVISLQYSEEFAKLTTFLADQIGKKYSDAVFIRLEPASASRNESWFAASKKIMKKTIDLNPHQTLILDLRKSLEDLQSGMHPKTRYNIKLAEKKELQLRVYKTKGDSLQEIAQAAKLFVATSKRAGIGSFDEQYYTKMFEYFASYPDQADLAEHRDFWVSLNTVWHETDLLAANFMVNFNGTAIYLFGGSADIKRNLMAPYFLHWDAIKSAKAYGTHSYDFWGVESDPKHPWYGFSRFKLGFGGEVVKYAGTWDFVLKPAWYNVYKLVRAVNRKLKKIGR